MGSSFAYGLMIRGTATELALVDANNDKAVGEMMDFNHGLSFVRPMKIAAGGYEDLAGSHVVVIAAGASQKPGESRLDLLPETQPSSQKSFLKSCATIPAASSSSRPIQ